MLEQSNDVEPVVLLLGGGYTLSRLAKRLAPGSFLITSRKAEKIDEFRSLGYLAEQLDAAVPKALDKVFSVYPTLHTVLDSCPPLRDRGKDPLSICKEVSRIAKSRRTQSLIYLSTTGVYGEDKGKEVYEDTPPEPQTEKGKLRLEAENIYRATGIPFCAVRCSAIYGPGRKLGRALEKGTYPLIGDGRKWTNRIHVEDLVSLLFCLLNTALENRPPIVNAADDHPTTQKELVTFFAQKHNLPLPQPISCEEAKERGMQTLLSHQRVSNRLMKELLGHPLQFPSFREGSVESE